MKLISQNRPRDDRRGRSGSRAFTIIEILLAVGIFMMVLTAIYATWMSILKGARAGQTAAAEAQRARVVVRTLEDAFNSAELFVGNIKHYRFEADTSGDMARVQLSARLPETFLGVGKYGDNVVRRLNFYTEPGENGMSDLIIEQWPILMNIEAAGVTPYRLTLTRDVTLFRLAFYDAQKGEWLDEWANTNALPKMVQIALGLGKLGTSGKPADVVYSLVAVPAVGVGSDIQGGAGRLPGMPFDPNNPNPGVLPPGTPGAPGVPGYPNTGLPPGFPGANPGFQNPGFQNPGFNNPYNRPGFRPGLQK